MSNYTIVCLGDSITCNENSPSYVNFWQELCDQQWGNGKVNVVSAGVNGETALDGYYRLEQDVLVHNPDLVTIMFGHNEVHSGVSVKVYQKYLNQTIDYLEARKPNVKIWLLTPTQIANEDIAKRYQTFIEALQTLNKPVLDMWSTFENQDLNKIFTYTFDYNGLTGQDYLHPNVLGHQIIAKSLFNHLAKDLSLK